MIEHDAKARCVGMLCFDDILYSKYCYIVCYKYIACSAFAWNEDVSLLFF